MNKIFLYEMKSLQDADLTTMHVFNSYSNNSLNLVSNMQAQLMSQTSGKWSDFALLRQMELLYNNGVQREMSVH